MMDLIEKRSLVLLNVRIFRKTVTLQARFIRVIRHSDRRSPLRELVKAPWRNEVNNFNQHGPYANPIEFEATHAGISLAATSLALLAIIASKKQPLRYSGSSCCHGVSRTDIRKLLSQDNLSPGIRAPLSVLDTSQQGGYNLYMSVFQIAPIPVDLD